jgi:hypothetical protein
MTAPTAPADHPGARLVQADLVGTVLLVVAGGLGAASADLAQVVLVPVSFALGAVGLVTFVWSYFSAIERSRTHEISVSQLYVVAGPVAPAPVKRLLKSALWAQVLVAITVMVFGFSRTEPQEFNWAACAIVAPMFGFGMNGMWVARHGSFGPRILTPRPTRRRRTTESRDSDPQMEQNSPHG